MKKLTFILFVIGLYLFAACSTPELSSPFGKKVKKEYFTGGQLRSEFIMDDDSGHNGLLKQYGYDGKLTSTTEIRNGVKHGVEILYDSRGRVLRKTPYYKNRRHGVVVVYYPNGEPLATISYVKGVKHGKAVKYNKNGSIFEKAMFKNGKRVN